MPTSASNSGSGRKISSPHCSPSNRWFWQGDGLPLTTQNTTGELLVSGTTCTRFRYLLAASLLRIIAGRCLRISPPTDGSKFTHQTSPRSIADITESGFRPRERFRLACFVLRHLLIGGFEVWCKHVGANQILDKATDMTATDYLM